jgi:hypothetical protein
VEEALKAIKRGSVKESMSVFNKVIPVAGKQETKKDKDFPTSTAAKIHNWPPPSKKIEKSPIVIESILVEDAQAQALQAEVTRLANLLSGVNAKTKTRIALESRVKDEYIAQLEDEIEKYSKLQKACAMPRDEVLQQYSWLINEYVWLRKKYCGSMSRIWYLTRNNSGNGSTRVKVGDDVNTPLMYDHTCPPHMTLENTNAYPSSGGDLALENTALKARCTELEDKLQVLEHVIKGLQNTRLGLLDKLTSASSSFKPVAVSPPLPHVGPMAVDRATVTQQLKTQAQLIHKLKDQLQQIASQLNVGLNVISHRVEPVILGLSDRAQVKR